MGGGGRRRREGGRGSMSESSKRCLEPWWEEGREEAARELRESQREPSEEEGVAVEHPLKMLEEGGGWRITIEGRSYISYMKISIYD